MADLRAQYERAQNAGAGASVLAGIQAEIDKLLRQPGPAPTQAQAQEAARKAEEAKRKAREAAEKAAKAGVTGSQLDEMNNIANNIKPSTPWNDSGSGSSGGWNDIEPTENPQARDTNVYDLVVLEARLSILKKFNYDPKAFFDFGLNTMTLGIYGRNVDFANNPNFHNVANSLTFGLVDNINRTFNNQNPLSLDHWINSGILVLGVGSILKLAPQPKLTSKPSGGTSVADDVINGVDDATNSGTLKLDMQFFAKKRDIQQLEAAAKKLNMTNEQRRVFGAYVESLKKGVRNDDNFTFEELLDIAEEFLGW